MQACHQLTGYGRDKRGWWMAVQCILDFGCFVLLLPQGLFLFVSFVSFVYREARRESRAREMHKVLVRSTIACTMAVLVLKARSLGPC